MVQNDKEGEFVMEEKIDVWCPRCMGDYIVGEIVGGQVRYPDVGKVIVNEFTEGSQVVLICRECGHLVHVKKDDLVVV